MSPTSRNDGACENTDREIYRERPDDYYADSIHVTEGGGIGINCGGMVYVKPIREWHRLAAASENSPQQGVPERPERMACKHGVRWPHDCSDCEQELAQRIAPASSERATDERLREIAKKHAHNACNPINALNKVSLQEEFRCQEIIFYALKDAVTAAPSATSPSEDEARLLWLEKVLQHCPHAELTHNDDEDDGPVGWSLAIESCSRMDLQAPTLAALIDLGMNTEPDEDGDVVARSEGRDA